MGTSVGEPLMPYSVVTASIAILLPEGAARASLRNAGTVRGHMRMSGEKSLLEKAIGDAELASSCDCLH